LQTLEKLAIRNIRFLQLKPVLRYLLISKAACMGQIVRSLPSMLTAWSWGFSIEFLASSMA